MSDQAERTSNQINAIANDNSAVTIANVENIEINISYCSLSREEVALCLASLPKEKVSMEDAKECGHRRLGMGRTRNEERSEVIQNRSRKKAEK
jgi:hypothetical protein